MATVDLFGNAQTCATTSTKPDQSAPKSPIVGLVWRPAVHSRGEAAWISARSWRAIGRADQLKAFKLAKLSLDAEVIAAAATDLADLVKAIVGKPGMVTCVPCGHSRRPDCFGFRLANKVATLIGSPFVEAWAFRPVSGSSHPKQFRHLPPLVPQDAIAIDRQCLLVVDDLVTSGYHMAEALTDARSRGVAAIGAAWINGTVAQ